MEHFYSIQGEGFHAGKAAYFIRLAGCSIGCHWCDVKESWDKIAYPPQSIETIIQQALRYPSRILIVTGGEPLEHSLDLLTHIAHQHQFRTHLETSGAFPLTGQWDWICISPKKNVPPLKDCLRNAHELKVVIYNHHDFVWAEENARYTAPHAHLFLQPEWSRKEKMIPLIVDYALKNPKWRISLQQHKYLNIP